MESLPASSSQILEAAYCHLESKVRQSRKLRVACAGREHCRPDYVVERDGYVCLGLELVVQGKGELCMAGKTFRLVPGHLFLYGPGIRHVIRCDPSAPMIKYFADFFGGSLTELFPGVIGPGGVRRTADIQTFRHLFDQLIIEGKQSTPVRKAICAEYMKLLLLKSTEAGNAAPRANSQSLNNLARCRACIDEHATSLSGLQALAEKVHLDPRYICRLFKRFNLPSPHRYLVTCRMNRAAELLATSSHPIKLIASVTGYEDPLHFSRVFSRCFLCSPSEFRQRNSKQMNPIPRGAPC